VTETVYRKLQPFEYSFEITDNIPRVKKGPVQLDNGSIYIGE
jgi:hypothetical protein